MSALEDDTQEVQIRVMMLADSAQAVGGKLYILGGGFDRINMPSVPFHHRFDLAMLIEVPWGPRTSLTRWWWSCTMPMER